VLNRLRRFGWFLLALGIGYALASGVVTETLTDLYHMVAMALNAYRLRAGSGGTVWLLVAGFLLGQGIVLMMRRLVLTLLPKTILWMEDDAAWDPALLLATRFGLQQYLRGSVEWAAQTSPESTQSIALLKISGLGRLNDGRGTRVATELLHDIAAQVRLAALPSTASRLSSLLTQHLPRRYRLHTTPEPRCAARWSGSTFALAFRGMEVNQAMGIVRELAAGIRSDLAELDEGLELRVAFAMGPVGTSARAVLGAASAAIEAADAKAITVAVDPKDGRVPLLATVQDVRTLETEMERSLLDSREKVAPEASGLRATLRAWGPVVACFGGVPIVMALGGGSGEIEKVYPWPPDLTTLPSVNASGTSMVRIVRQDLPGVSSADWEISGSMTQAEPGQHRILGVEFHLAVTNRSKSGQYVSVYDFTALDASGKELEFVPRRVMRMPEPLDAKWLQPGETWSGWLSINRKEEPVRGIVFRPDRRTQLIARSADLAKTSGDSAPASPPKNGEAQP
jgi:GGDEF domain-containing protein